MDISVLDGAFPVAFSAPVCRRDGARLACLPSIGLAGAAQLVGIFAASACFVGLYIFVIDIDRQLIRRKDVENGFGLVSEMFFQHKRSAVQRHGAEGQAAWNDGQLAVHFVG